MAEYAVLDKDTIKSEIMPYLSVAKRVFSSKFYLVEIVNSTLYNLKSGMMRRCTRKNEKLNEPTQGWLLSEPYLYGLTLPYLVGRAGISWPLSLFSLKKHTKQINLNNFSENFINFAL